MSCFTDILLQNENNCFVRFIGVNRSYTEDIAELDRLYGSWDYVRVNGLMPPQDKDELERLRHEAIGFENSFEGARVLALYRSSVPSVNPSIEKNLVISLLYWSALLETEKGVFVYSGKTGYKEYLFCYFAHLKGWQVLMLMPVGEGRLSDVLLEKSDRIALGEETAADIPQFVPRLNHAPHRPPAPAHTEDHTGERSAVTGNIRVKMPPRPGRGGSPVRDSRANTPPRPNSRVSIPPRPDRNGAPPFGADRGRVPPRPSAPSRPAAPPMNSGVGWRGLPPRPANNTPQTAPRPAGRVLSWSDIAGLSGSVVKLEALGYAGAVSAHGSGVAISSYGYILTGFSLLRDSMQIKVKVERDDKTYYARVIKYHTEHDLAVIKIERLLTPLPIFTGTPEPSIGQPIYLIGSGGGRLNNIYEGTITGFRSYYGYNNIVFSAQQEFGSGGGALLNNCGELIGLCFGKAYGVHAADQAVTSRLFEPFVRGFLV
ncbi:MAG TPA: hypothetical protein DHV89_10425 [Ruminococcus sp.]|nr:hypothetical protein [Ruminococcus sp.]